MIGEVKKVAEDNRKNISDIRKDVAVFTEKHRGYDKWVMSIGSVIMALVIGALAWLGSLIVGNK